MAVSYYRWAGKCTSVLEGPAPNRLERAAGHREARRDCPRRMNTNRLETFADGVFAIAATLLILNVDA